jgi:2-phosphoglycerate kinase
LLLKENDLWEIVDKVVPSPTDLQQLAAHEKKEIRAMRVILDVVKDHLIPHLFEKKTTKEMFDALVSLYQSENINRKMVLRNKLRSTQMSRSDSVTSYLMKITQICDQLWGEDGRCRIGKYNTEWILKALGSFCQGYRCTGEPSHF